MTRHDAVLDNAMRRFRRRQESAVSRRAINGSRPMVTMIMMLKGYAAAVWWRPRKFDGKLCGRLGTEIASQSVRVRE